MFELEILDMIQRKSIALILGGGRGTRLFPMTLSRCKPAISFGGQYRLIDISISNCINSGIGKIYVLTQFLSVGLNSHITNTYRFDSFSSRFVEIWADEQSTTNFSYSQGTADAVRRHIEHIENSEADYIFVLPGDQLCRIDLKDMLYYHIQSKADITIACLKIKEKDVDRFGIMKINEENKITDFTEKPKDQKIISEYRLKMTKSNEGSFLGSMGLYIFNKEILLNELRKLENNDFGRDILPRAIKEQNVNAFIFKDYWEDIGTIKSYFEASMNLLQEEPPFSFYDLTKPIFTNPRFLPPSKIFKSSVDKSIISDGSIISGSAIKESIIGIRSYIGSDSTVDNAVIMGNDKYPKDFVNLKLNKNQKFGIGNNCRIKKAIIDKNVIIGENCEIIGSEDENIVLKQDEKSNFHIINGIIVIPRRTAIAPNTKIIADNYKK